MDSRNGAILCVLSCVNMCATGVLLCVVVCDILCATPVVMCAILCVNTKALSGIQARDRLYTNPFRVCYNRRAKGCSL